MQRLLVLGVLWAAWACDDAPTSGADTGGALADSGPQPVDSTVDSSRPDAQRDAGIPVDAALDAAPPADARVDAAAADVGLPDAAAADVGLPDAQVEDAAPLDAQLPDAAPPLPENPLLITEVVARSDGTLLDEDGEDADWIELYNPNDVPWPLEGFHLTDDPANPTPWTFPEVDIPPRGYRVVFASGKDRDRGELHTDFSLSGEGEQVVLTAPDGAVVARLEFPLQAEGLSYGLPMRVGRQTFVGTGSPGRVRVPDAGDPADWFQPASPDADWAPVTLAVGDDQSGPPRATLVISDASGAFSGGQGQAGWSYGYFDATNDNVYDSADFRPFPAAGGPHGADNFWTGQAWDWFAGDPPYTLITATGGHPNGRNHGPLHFPVRRFTSPLAGTLEIFGQVGNPAEAGDGTTSRIFVDGEEVFARHLDGEVEPYAVRVIVEAGSFIDFALDPGPAGDDTGDGSIFTAQIALPGNGLDARGPLVTDSRADWSADGRQGENRWSYGYFDRTGDPDGRYAAGDFRPFPRDNGPRSATNFWDGDVFDWFPQDPPFTLVGRELMVPSGVNTGREHWAIRRFQVAAPGTYLAEWTLAKVDAAGGGVTGRLFHQGREIDAFAIEGDDQVGVTRVAVLEGVNAGDVVDLALDPLGPEGDRSDTSDGSNMVLRLWPARSIAEELQSDIGDLRGDASEVRLRVPFEVPGPIEGRLLLKMRYDDGFRAWVDGRLVAFDNAPARLDRTTGEALEPRVGQLAGLAPGPHLLAVAGYNAAGNDGQFFLDPALEAVQLEIGATPRHLPLPTPGADNVGLGVDDPPVVVDLDRHQDVTAADDILVRTLAVGVSAPIAEVTLVHRRMFEPEQRTLMMPDGENSWLVALPPTPAGQLVRWYVVVTDTNGRSTRYPPFVDPLDSEEYFGTVVRQDIETALPTFHWFAANPDGAATDAGTRTTLWFDGELYDNVRADLHGQSSRGFPKKSYNIDFNEDHRFRWQDDLARMRDLNLLSNYADKSKARNTLAYGIYRDAGADHHLATPVRVHLNGQFFSVADFVEDGDDKWLERLGYPDPVGPLYKMYDNMSNPNQGEKKTRKDEGSADLAALIAGLGLEPVSRRLFIYDNVDLARMANFLAAMIVSAGLDCCHKNYYAYQDPRTNEWWYMIWDADLTLGRNWTGNYFDDRMYPQNPLYVGRNNRLIGPLFDMPEFNEMYRRRLRTLMDALVQPPETPAENLILEARADAVRAQVGADGDLDNARWQTWGIPQSVDEGVRIMKDEFLGPRRTYLYGLVSRAAREVTTLVDGARGEAIGRYLVPVDDALGDAWTAHAFDDMAWGEGPLGIGYEASPAEYSPFLATVVQPNLVHPQATTVLVRIPFQVEDPAVVENLVLRLRYDDGVVVYLNGVEVARRGLPPGPVAWNTSSAVHDDAAAIVWEDQVIQAQAGLLRAGPNTLAVRLVNAGAGSSDLLLAVALVDGLPGGDGPLPEAQGEVLVAVEALDASPDDPDAAYVVLHNQTGTSVDLSGWRLIGGGIEHRFTPGTVLPTDGRLYVAADARAFRDRDVPPAGGQGLFVQGNWTGALVPDGQPRLERVP